MNAALIFFLLLVPLSGFIAWAGDRIGHKCGKKRHSLFGLRPRHTAIVITIAAGMCIATVSIAAVWFSNEQFRQIIAQGYEFEARNAALKQDNEEMRRQAEAKRDEVNHLDAAVQQYRAQA